MRGGSCFVLEGFWEFHAQGCIWKAGKGKGILDCVIWRRMVSKPGVKQMGGAKEIEAFTLVSRSLSSKRLEQVGTTRKEWVR